MKDFSYWKKLFAKQFFFINNICVISYDRILSHYYCSFFVISPSFLAVHRENQTISLYSRRPWARRGGPCCPANRCGPSSSPTSPRTGASTPSSPPSPCLWGWCSACVAVFLCFADFLSSLACRFLYFKVYQSRNKFDV